MVTKVIVVSNKDTSNEEGVEIEQIGINFCSNLLGGTWKQTSYNGRIRKNYAGIGYVYDAGRDAFYAPQPFASWILDETTCHWQPPIAQPEAVMPTTETEGTYYEWDESIVNWKAITIPKLETQA